MLASPAVARSLGDVDKNGIFTVLDSANQVSVADDRVPLPEAERTFADVNADSVLNHQDSIKVTKLILYSRERRLSSRVDGLSSSLAALLADVTRRSFVTSSAAPGKACFSRY